MTKEELDFIGSMNMCDEISTEAYKKIVCHCREQEPCEDAISRKALISHIEMQSREWGEDYDAQQILGDIEDMSSVKPQEKTGHWDSRTCKCSECGYQITFSEYTEHKYKYCPNCGTKMIEPQESEDKE